MQAGLAYVMLGRCQRLEDLFIVRDKYDVSKIRCCKEAKHESDNLDERAEERKRNGRFFEEGKIHLGFMNIRSLRAHWTDFTGDESFKKCQIIGLCETNLHQDEEVTMPNYETELVNVGKGQGIASFNRVQANTVFTFRSKVLSIIALVYQQWLIIFVYASQDASKDDIIAKLANICENKDTNIIIMGDFNYDYPRQDNKLKRYLKQNDFLQLINSPTFESGSTLDHVYVKGIQPGSLSVSQKARYYSDHDAIFVRLNE